MRRFAFKAGVLLVGALLSWVGLADSAWAKPKKKPLLLIDLGIGVSETYDDNVFQIKNFAENDYITQVAPSVSIDLGAIRWLKLRAGYSPIYKYYAVHDNLNELLHKFDFDLGIDLTNEKRFRNFRLGTDISYTPISVSVLNSANSSINTTQRLQLGLAPGYLWVISPVWDLDFAGHVQRQMFFDQGADNTSFDGAITLRRRFFRRVFLKGAGNGTYQKFDDLGVTKIYGGSGGFDVEISKRLQAGASVGYQIIDLPEQSGQNGRGSQGDALTIHGNLDWMITKRTTVIFELNRANTVDLNNNDFLSTRGTLSIRHRLSARSLLGLSAFYQQAQQDTQSGTLQLKNQLDTIGGTLRLQFLDNWSTSVNITHDKNAGAYLVDDYDQTRYTLEVRYHYPIRIR